MFETIIGGCKNLWTKEAEKIRKDHFIVAKSGFRFKFLGQIQVRLRGEECRIRSLPRGDGGQLGPIRTGPAPLRDSDGEVGGHRQSVVAEGGRGGVMA
jgi:hypothetical protein